MSSVKERIKELSKKYLEEVISIRRHLHANPELSFEEMETGKFIADKLSEKGIEHTTGWAGHGVVGMIYGHDSSPNLALRADIDALPIKEENDVPYKSQNEGVMHACGHDVHTSCLLGASFILHELRTEIKGSVKLIFQPGEEKLPGGASILLKEGVLENPNVDAILGQHVHPPLEVGKVGIKAGPYMASADEIYITVVGKGAHGALPQDGIDTILVASSVVTALQQIVSRNSSPFTPSVLTIGKIWSDGGATNIIPERVHMEGTFRTMDEDWRVKAHDLIHQIVQNTCSAMGATVLIEVRKGYPNLKNDLELSASVKKRMIEYLGDDNVVELPLRMTAEDFSYYSQVAKSCFYRLGTGNKSRGITSSVHTPTFDIDEDALRVGMGLMAFLAIEELKSK